MPATQVRRRNSVSQITALWNLCFRFGGRNQRMYVHYTCKFGTRGLLHCWIYSIEVNMLRNYPFTKNVCALYIPANLEREAVNPVYLVSHTLVRRLVQKKNGRRYLQACLVPCAVGQSQHYGPLILVWAGQVLAGGDSRISTEGNKTVRWRRESERTVSSMIQKNNVKVYKM